MHCFIDFDGTLATDDGLINKENLQFVKNNEKQFILSTGRNLSQINEILDRYNFKIDAIGGNGAFIYKNGNIQINNTVEPTTTKMLLKKLQKLCLPVIIHTVYENYLFVNLNDHGSYDGITDKLFDIIHHKGAFYYGN